MIGKCSLPMAGRLYHNDLAMQLTRYEATIERDKVAQSALVSCLRRLLIGKERPACVLSSADTEGLHICASTTCLLSIERALSSTPRCLRRLVRYSDRNFVVQGVDGGRYFSQNVGKGGAVPSKKPPTSTTKLRITSLSATSLLPSNRQLLLPARRAPRLSSPPSR